MNLSGAPDVAIGAVGLGSSNDFHKPFHPEAFINGIAVRIDFQSAFHCDVIRIDYRDIEGRWGTRFCLINGSIGITAAANAIFNSRLRIIRMLQRASVNAAITAAALKAIFTYPNIPCRLTVEGSLCGSPKATAGEPAGGSSTREPSPPPRNAAEGEAAELSGSASSFPRDGPHGGEERRVAVTNLGVVKNPHFAGSFCYDTPIKPDDGKLGVHLSMGLSLCGRIRLLAALRRSRFRGRPNTMSWMATRVSVKGDQGFALEADGEVIHADRAEFQILPKRVRCCR
jgi:diacylglycerol kinase family enzyme